VVVAYFGRDIDSELKNSVSAMSSVFTYREFLGRIKIKNNKIIMIFLLL
jgi:hypothetical protein